MLTLADYSAAKKLPVLFLRNLGLVTEPKGVAIPYYNAALVPIRTRYRHRMTGEPRFSWGEGDTLIAYGLWALSKKAKEVILVEGESDTQTLLFHGFNVLGVPGAGTWRREWRVHLAPYRKVFVWAEGDSASDGLIQRVAADWGKVYVLSVPGYKDASELHIADPDGFTVAVKEALATAAPYKGRTTAATRRFWRPTRQRTGEDAPLPDIVTICERQGVQLRRVGSQLIGLCPFHEDRHPSLSVSPAKDSWFCHSEGIGGGVRQFMERVNGR